MAQPRLSDLRALDTLDAGQQMRLATISRRVVRSTDDSLPFSSLFAIAIRSKKFASNPRYYFSLIYIYIFRYRSLNKDFVLLTCNKLTKVLFYEKRVFVLHLDRFSSILLRVKFTLTSRHNRHKSKLGSFALRPSNLGVCHLSQGGVVNK